MYKYDLPVTIKDVFIAAALLSFAFYIRKSIRNDRQAK